jgi:hypothetical protein
VFSSSNKVLRLMLIASINTAMNPRGQAGMPT